MVVKTAVLKELETLYAKSGNQLCVLYGRPDLEKELLLKTFLQNKKSLFIIVHGMRHRSLKNR